jgi:mono/diheme cytochrome c family protein
MTTPDQTNSRMEALMSVSKLKSILVCVATIALVAGVGMACDKSGEASSGGEKSAAASGGTATDIDHGGITEVSTDAALIKKGEGLFTSKTCNACHAMDKKMVGPPLAGITDKREAAWLAQMIMHPDEMIKKDPVAKKLFEEYGTPMATPPVSAEEAKAIIAYLGTK